MANDVLGQMWSTGIQRVPLQVLLFIAIITIRLYLNWVQKTTIDIRIMHISVFEILMCDINISHRNLPNVL